MGMFLSLSGVIGRNQNQVRDALTNYAVALGGGLLEAKLTTEESNCCAIEEAHNNTSIFYPGGFVEWERCSEYLSRELNTPVFSFHIHDGDLWMYVLYVNGKIVDQFNPIPDYWDNDLSDEEIQSWKGNASVVSKYVGMDETNISKYLTRWNLDSEDVKRAYDDDEYTNEDWQLLDFLRKCGLPYPVDIDGNVKGITYKLWTKELRLFESTQVNSMDRAGSGRPWWKFWN